MSKELEVQCGATSFVQSWYANDAWYPKEVLGVDPTKVIRVNQEEMSWALRALKEGVRLDSFDFWEPPIFRDNNSHELRAYSNIPRLFNGVIVVYSYHHPDGDSVTILPEHVITVISEKNRFGNDANLIMTADRLKLPLEERVKP